MINSPHRCGAHTRRTWWLLSAGGEGAGQAVGQRIVEQGVQRRRVDVDAPDHPQRDQPVRGGPQLQHVLPGLPVTGGGEQAGQYIADGLPFVPGIGSPGWWVSRSRWIA